MREPPLAFPSPAPPSCYSDAARRVRALEGKRTPRSAMGAPGVSGRLRARKAASGRLPAMKSAPLSRDLDPKVMATLG
jgi:hypothetical protein